MAEERADPLTGEILDNAPRGEFAADGGIVPYAAGSAGEIINMLEDGQLSADIVRDMGDLVAKMTELAENTGNKQKGSLTIKVDLVTEGGPFTATASYKITPPRETRRRTLVFVDDTNRLTRTQPRQRQFFGVRQVGGADTVRRV